MQFSWMALQVLKQERFTEKSINQRDEYETRTRKVVDLIPKLMKRASRNSWTCDPEVHVKGQTYDEVTKLLQGYIENEVNLNTENTCKQTCEFYEVSNATCLNDKEDGVRFCARSGGKMCRGTILDCQFVDADMSVCVSVSYSHTNLF